MNKYNPTYRNSLGVFIYSLWFIGFLVSGHFMLAFLMIIPVLLIIFISFFQDRKRNRCPKCKTKYKDGFMEFGPDKVISTFKCKKCGYEKEIIEPFNFKEYKRMFNDAVDSGKFTPEQVRELEELSEKYDKIQKKRE